jgi:tetratricopeptide (TPR) repeat protein|tara:strand:+ start:6823 stop:7830 length:1008 start_codon:yes stop_codon:yes gene_type:complete
MQNKVKIIADEMGNVIRQSSTSSEYGYVRLQHDRVTFGITGYENCQQLSTLLHGKLEDLQSLGLGSMETIPGRIIIKEQLAPFSQNDPDRDLKYAGDTGIICCVDGEPIYRTTFYVADATSQDVLIKMNNTQQVDNEVNESFMLLFVNCNFKELLKSTRNLIESNIKSQLIFYYAGLAAQELEHNNMAKEWYTIALKLKDGMNIFGGGPTRIFVLNNLSNLLFDLGEFQNCHNNCQDFLSLSSSFSKPFLHVFRVNNYYLSAASICNLYRDFNPAINQNNMLGQMKVFKIKKELHSALQHIDEAIRLTLEVVVNDGNYFLDDYKSVQKKIIELMS